MPGFLVHLGATVQCVHGGQAQPVLVSPRVQVMGQPVVLQPGPYLIAGCPFTIVSPVPCVTAQIITAATRVTSMGMPVVLIDSQSVCAPNGTPLIIASTQTRVTGT